MNRATGHQSDTTQSGSGNDRRFNKYEMSDCAGHEIGIEIGEEGFKICDEDSGICPIEGVATLDEAAQLQSLAAGNIKDRRQD
ncbi:MAG: hypothetical protein HQL69_24700 [Magnetococcales bacterium]|nr:hypothetical protein [Magnetococcales bacterium]